MADCSFYTREMAAVELRRRVLCVRGTEHYFVSCRSHRTKMTFRETRSERLDECHPYIGVPCLAGQWVTGERTIRYDTIR